MRELKAQVNNRSITVDVTKAVYINNNYLRLNNKPSINGVQLNGNKNADELNLLSKIPEQYTQISLESADKADFLLVLGKDNQPKKMKIGDISSRTLQTVKVVPSDFEIGSYIFLLMEGK